VALENVFKAAVEKKLVSLAVTQEALGNPTQESASALFNTLKRLVETAKADPESKLLQVKVVLTEESAVMNI
jgi:hypothetical protein